MAAPVPAAELEAEDESGLVIAETPTAPMNNMAILFNQVCITKYIKNIIRSCLYIGDIT